MLRTALAASLLVLALAVPAHAAPREKLAATVTLDDPTPAFGQVVTYAVETNATLSYLRVQCGTFYDGYGRYHYTPSYTDTLTLDSGAWVSGGADCTASVVTWHNGRRLTIGATEFTVSP
jgi:hypothetical protein